MLHGRHGGKLPVPAESHVRSHQTACSCGARCAMSCGKKYQTMVPVPWSPSWGCVPVDGEPDQEPHKPPIRYAPKQQPLQKGHPAEALPSPLPPALVQPGTSATPPTCQPPSGSAGAVLSVERWDPWGKAVGAAPHGGSHGLKGPKRGPPHADECPGHVQWGRPGHSQ